MSVEVPVHCPSEPAGAPGGGVTTAGTKGDGFRGVLIDQRASKPGATTLSSDRKCTYMLPVAVTGESGLACPVNESSNRPLASVPSYTFTKSY